MALSDWHSRFSEALTIDGILRTSAWSLVESELSAAKGVHRGMVLGSRALLRSKDGPVFALAALSDIEEALPLLAGDMLEQFRLLLIAQSICRESRLVSRAHRYQEKLHVLLVADHEDRFTEWMGRILIGQGQYQLLIEDYEAASRALHSAVRWHEENVGPYGEHDRRCYLAMSLLHLGSVQLKLSGPDAAELLLERAMSEMPADSQREGIIYELKGLIALERGDIASAQSAGAAMLELAGNYAYWGAELLAKAAMISEDSGLCRQYVEEGIRLAVATGDWVRVHTLERLGSQLLHKC